MAEKIQLEVEVKGGESVASASNKVKSLKQQLREMKAELASGNLGAKEFAALSQRAGELQDRIGDVNNQVKNLASDTKKLDGFINVAQGIAGGFAAAQGAIALFGSENEDLQKTLVKVQGAVALLSGVQAIANVLQKDSAAMTLLNTTRLNILTAAQARYTAVVGTTTGALKALRIVGATLGIGLIVAAIAVLISKFDSIKKTVEKFIPSLATVGKFFKMVWQNITDFVGATSDATRALDKLIEANERSIKSQENDIELMKVRGATMSQVYLAEFKLIQDRINLLNLQAQKEKKWTEEMVQQKADFVQQQKVLTAQYEKDRQTEENKAAEERLNKQKQAGEKAKAERKRQHDEELRQQAELNKKRLELGEDTFKEYQKLFRTSQENELQAIRDNYQEKFNLALGDIETTKQLTALMNSEISAVNQKYRDEEDAKKKEANDKQLADKKAFDEAIVASENAVQEAKRGALDAGFNIAQEFAGKNKQLANVLFAIQKGTAIAQVIVDTQKEIAGYYSNPTWSLLPDGGATIKTAYASAAKIRAATSIATIGATAIGRFTNPSGGGTSSGGSGGQMSNQPNIQGYTTNNIPNQQRGGSGNMRVYVTETDIRNSSRKVDGIYSQATVE